MQGDELGSRKVLEESYKISEIDDMGLCWEEKEERAMMILRLLAEL